MRMEDIGHCLLVKDMPASARRPPRRRPAGRVGTWWPAGIDSWQGTDGTEDARQPVVQGRSFSGFNTAQMWVIRSPATSNAYTATVTPSC
jgi:hypothetical protein